MLVSSESLQNAQFMVSCVVGVIVGKQKSGIAKRNLSRVCFSKLHSCETEPRSQESSPHQHIATLAGGARGSVSLTRRLQARSKLTRC
jgi:hypothetical protein